MRPAPGSYEPVTLSVIRTHGFVYRAALVTRAGRVLHAVNAVSLHDVMRLARRYAERAGFTVVREVIS